MILNRFQTDIDDNVITIERVRTADGEPVVYCIDKVPANIYRRIFKEQDGSIFSTLEKSGNIRIAMRLHILTGRISRRSFTNFKMWS